MKNPLKDYQGVWSLLAALTLFWLTPTAFALARSTAGTIDGAYLQALVFSAIVFFSAIFCGWVALQIDWKFLNRYIDSDALGQDWIDLKPIQRVLVFLGTICFLISLFVLCYAFLPKP